jgi:hypothetical protein
MIQYTDIVRYDNLSFEDYLKLNGHSHSFLKANIQGVRKFIDVTDNMRVGSMVDAILTEPAKADMSSELYPHCKAIAFELKKMFGDVMMACKKQISYTANATFNGLSIPTTGRLDFLLENAAVIDLKITQSKDVDALIKYMGYENQVWHYSKMAKVSKAYLIMYSVPLKKVIVKFIDASSDMNEFWVNKIIDFGMVPA